MEEKRFLGVDEGMPPLSSTENYSRLLQFCRIQSTHQHTILRLYADIQNHGYNALSSILAQFVSMLVYIGSVGHMQQIMDDLIYQKTFSHGVEPKASVQPDPYVQHSCCRMFVALLQVCTMLKDLERGIQLHVIIVYKGLTERDVSIGSTLVDMYAKCGSLARAQEVFDNLPICNAVSWTALIAGYVDHMREDEALRYFEDMRHEGIPPDDVLFAYGLKACGAKGAVDKGRKIHTEIVSKGMEQSVIAGGTLLDMYCKCGLLIEAHDVFGKLQNQDVVTWTALIAGYVEQDHAKQAIDCFKQMRQSGILPDAVTFICTLKACSDIGAAQEGRMIHNEIIKKGVELHQLAGNTLVDMYVESGFPAEAQKVFEKLPSQTVSSWNTMIKGLIEQGLGEEALTYVKHMQQSGIPGDIITFACSLKACGIIRATSGVLCLHSEIVAKGLERELLVVNTLIDSYCKCGCLRESQEVFDKLSSPDRVTWTALIGGYAEHGNGEDALKCFEEMRCAGISPDAVTYFCSLKACGSIGAAFKGRELHSELAKRAMLGDPLVGNSIIDMYAKCGSLAEAQDTLDKLSAQDIVACNSLITEYAEQSHGERALHCVESLQVNGFSADTVTFLGSLKACSVVGSGDKSYHIHGEIAKRGLDNDIALGNMLIDSYSKCGFPTQAQAVFDKLLLHSEVTWNALITGYSQLGDINNVFSLVEKMLDKGLEPDNVTFIGVLNACRHSGLVDEGAMYFCRISKDYGIVTTMEHYISMIDLLSCAGLVENGVTMINHMPFHPTFVVWHTVLGSCHKFGNLELARQAFECAVQLDEKDTFAYVCMSNIYVTYETQAAAKELV